MMTNVDRTSLDGSMLEQSGLCGNLSGLEVEREIRSRDGKIDRLAPPAETSYELYGLTEEEIRIVEGAR